jgi:hypothetical protein
MDCDDEVRRPEVHAQAGRSESSAEPNGAGARRRRGGSTANTVPLLRFRNLRFTQRNAIAQGF